MLAFNIIYWLEKHELACPFKQVLGFDCPGCGIQRSLVELLKGNLYKSMAYHPATIPLILFFLFSVMQLIRPIRSGNNIIVYGYLFIVVVTLTNYIYKIIYLP